jgi:predicted lipoprotein with Yx(FWY)xxD motif
MKNRIPFATLLMLMLVISACGTAVQTALPATPIPVIPNTGLATDTPVAMATPAGPALVNAGLSATLGSILVDTAGMTLYVFTQDSPGTSTCYTGCDNYWPPLLTNGAPLAGTGVTASMLGTITRTDGSIQVTYNSWPLYYFIKDKVAGDILGQGVQSSWYAITPAGTIVTGAMPAAAPSTMPMATPTSGY